MFNSFSYGLVVGQTNLVKKHSDEEVFHQEIVYSDDI